MEFEASDVVRLIEQYFKENNLNASLKALQVETGVFLNTVDSVEMFTKRLIEGKWDEVLSEARTLRLADEKLIDLYEQITFELIEMREIGAARSLIRQTRPLQLLYHIDPSRFSTLENLLTQSQFDPREVYGNISVVSRREAIAEKLSGELSVATPSRLLCLLGQALKFQQHQGLLPPGCSIDIFRGRTNNALHEDEQDKFPQTLATTINFGSKCHAECAAFSPDGQLLVTGSADGFIEIWNYNTGKLRKDLTYQAEDRFMLMDDSILCLCFSRDSELIASGSKNGRIYVWKVESGQCLRKFENAHCKGVTSVQFAKDASQLLSASYDGSIRLHGLRSGKLLKEFKGHHSFVNCALFNPDFSTIISGSSDGTVKLWTLKGTLECQATFRPSGSQSTAMDIPVNCISLIAEADQFLVSTRSNNATIMNESGQILKSFVVNRGLEFVCSTVSPRTKFVYCATSDSSIHCFNATTGKLENSLNNIHSKSLIGITHHPHQNLMATFAEDGTLKLWRA